MLLPAGFQTETHKHKHHTKLLVLRTQPSRERKDTDVKVSKHQSGTVKMKLSILAFLALAVLQVSGHPYSQVLELETREEQTCVPNGGMLHQGSVLACISSARANTCLTVGNCYNGQKCCGVCNVHRCQAA